MLRNLIFNRKLKLRHKFHKFFPNSQILGFLNVALSGLLKHGKLGFFNLSLGCTCKVFPNLFQIFRKLRFLRSPLFHILLNCEDSLSGTGCL